MNPNNSLQRHEGTDLIVATPSEIQSLNFGLFDVEELEHRLEMIAVPPDCTTDICVGDICGIHGSCGVNVDNCGVRY
jgi:hypothetical protein